MTNHHRCLADLVRRTCLAVTMKNDHPQGISQSAGFQLLLHFCTSRSASASSLILCCRKPCRSFQKSSVCRICFPLGTLAGGGDDAFSIPSILSGIGTGAGGADASASASASFAAAAPPPVDASVLGGGSGAPPNTITPSSTVFPFPRISPSSRSLTVFLFGGTGFLL
jgi:hypothetical protein